MTNLSEGPRMSRFETKEETEDPLDRATVENLRELGGSEILSELAQMFSEDTRSALAILREAAKSGDASSVERAAHTLKGSSGSMGATRMAKISAELQDSGASGDLSRAPGLLGHLEDEFERVRPALEAEVERTQG